MPFKQKKLLLLVLLIHNWYISFIIIIFLPSTSNFAVTIMSSIDLAGFSIVNEDFLHTGSDSCIQKITDGKNIFIIKQINNPSIDEQFLLINDVIASSIGFQLDIPINQVSFVPYNVGAHLKVYSERAATLHNYISGNDLEFELPVQLPTNFSLQQRVINKQSIYQQKYPLPDKKQGLTRNIIESMSINECFCCICALDTFVGNADRSLPNIFYDKMNNQFFGIDQAASFSRELPQLAYSRIQELLIKNYFKVCSLKIAHGMRIYKDVLRKICLNNHPNIIVKNMQQLIPYLAENILENTVIQARLKHHSAIIEHNYSSVLKLIELLDVALS